MTQPPHNPHLRGHLLEVVENQLRDGTPPETAATLARLIEQGDSRERAIELIACVLVTEIFDVLKNRGTYDEARYTAALRRLPEMPPGFRS